tara:strand:- start:1595 stop:2620 length:1026 start_codon:yes stop_codon:yes gene_type:complete
MFTSFLWRDDEEEAGDDTKFEEQQEGSESFMQEESSEIQQQEPLQTQQTLRAIKDAHKASSSEEKAAPSITARSSSYTERKGGEYEGDSDNEQEENEGSLIPTDLENTNDAFEYCEQLVEQQIKRSHQTNANMNEVTYGDTDARRAIKTLLSDNLIRELFLKTTRSRSSWPRLRPLFGTPPYNFLRPEDAGLVRAAGLCRGRVNMAYEKAGTTATYSQFGVGHLVDSYAREYRVLAQSDTISNTTLPFDFRNIQPNTHIKVNVRVPKRAKKEKLEMMKNAARRRSLVFPAVGEHLKLSYSPALKKVWGNKQLSVTIKLIVKRVVPRSSNGSTAALIAINDT